MFVEKLNSDDIKEYLIQNTECDNEIIVRHISGKTWQVLNYIENKNSGRKIKSINVDDFKLNYLYNKKWCKYLYKKFGKEYIEYYDKLYKIYDIPKLIVD